MTTKNQASSNTAAKSIATQFATKSSTKQTASKEVTDKKPTQAKLKKPIDNSVNELIAENELKKLFKKKKHNKVKVIRDSFSFPEQDYQKISELKKICLSEGIHVKKGELLRAGLHLLTNLNLIELKQAVAQVEKIKTGRPSSTKH